MGSETTTINIPASAAHHLRFIISGDIDIEADSVHAAAVDLDRDGLAKVLAAIEEHRRELDQIGWEDDGEAKALTAPVAHLRARVATVRDHILGDIAALIGTDRDNIDGLSWTADTLEELGWEGLQSREAVPA